MKTDVILTANIVGLGAESDQVRVAAGYARNYLFPRGLAIPLTQATKRRIEVLRQRRAEREAQEFNTMTELARALSKLICVIKVKTGEDGKMFGAVTAGMIAEELKHQFDVSLDKRKIHLEHPIKALGDYDVQLDLHAEVKGTLKVRVESTTPITAPPAAPAPAETKKEEAPAGPADKKARRAAKTSAEKAGTETAQAAGGKKEKPAKAQRAPKTSRAEKPAKESPQQ
jgi:large subunit ribosomal protein L9